MPLSGHWRVSSQKRQSKPKSYIYIHDWNTEIPTHFTLLGISKSIWRLKLQWDFRYKFIWLGCRTWNWFSYSFKGKLKVILYTFLKIFRSNYVNRGYNMDNLWQGVCKGLPLHIVICYGDMSMFFMTWGSISILCKVKMRPKWQNLKSDCKTVRFCMLTHLLVWCYTVLSCLIKIWNNFKMNQYDIKTTTLWYPKCVLFFCRKWILY